MKNSKPRRRVVMARKIRLGEDDGSFDAEFWRRVGPEGRLAAMWQMVREYDLIRGGDGRIPPLQRTVAVLKRRKVRFLIVGAHAVAYHAEPRYTKDLDVLVESCRVCPVTQHTATGVDTCRCVNGTHATSLAFCSKLSPETPDGRLF